jgi:molecular chaperone HtpG
MSDIVVGKNILETLSTGMYADPRTIYREYIQNATDSIDSAVRQGIITKEEGEIHIKINTKFRVISIRDNGVGIPYEKVLNTLSDVGNSSKDYTENRGFRGIGRLAGLAYCKTLYFVTSAKGESVETVMKWDCQKMKELLSPSNNSAETLVDVIKAISDICPPRPAKADEHYFEVRLEDVDDDEKGNILIDESNIRNYLAIVAPVDFDGQKFRQAKKIKEFYKEKGQMISTYRIFFGDRKQPVYKLYTQRLDTNVGRGKQKEDELIKDVELLYKTTENDEPLYIGWLAITGFSGQIRDPNLRGIRLRKSNIQIGDSQTFDSYFPAEGNNANKMFAGEIHVLDREVIPNSQRDDFEPSDSLYELKRALSQWAGEINKQYRRGTSQASSSMRKIEEGLKQQQELAQKIERGGVSSDAKKEELAKELEKVQRTIKRESGTLQRAIKNSGADENRQEKVNALLEKARKSSSEAVSLSNKIVQAKYATKEDLPTSYSREERKLYQRIISVIDSFFTNDPKIAENLREKIKQELSVKKK